MSKLAIALRSSHILLSKAAVPAPNPYSPTRFAENQGTQDVDGFSNPGICLEDGDDHM